jgi:hypothetical protein
MGRLTLNVLLSFAQFEREVTGERIRDKVAASKAKGMWMGGNLPLGYDLGDRRLVINEAEAAQVRYIFTRYLELGSAVELMQELRAGGTRSKRWTARSGREIGGVPLSCGALYYILQNRLYLGEVVHRGIRHEGEHEAIISQELFRKVEGALARNRRERRSKPRREAKCHLIGRVVDADGTPMTSSFSYGRRGRCYRYYVSPGALPARTSRVEGIVRRVPAAGLEGLVLRVLGRVLGSSKPPPWHDILPLLHAVEIRERSLHLIIVQSGVAEPHEPTEWLVQRIQGLLRDERVAIDADGSIRVILDRTARFRGSPTYGSTEQHVGGRGALPTLWRSAHELLRRHSMSPLDGRVHHQAQAPREQRHRRLMMLGLLAPSIQSRLAKGGVTAGLETKLLLQQMPLAWEDQAAFLGT